MIIPTNKGFNGPSGNALDNLYLTPLGLNRKSVWLCDLLNESRMNEGQGTAIHNNYTDDIIEKFNLSQASVPVCDDGELYSEQRRKEIIEELEASQAETIIFLGDKPIKWSSRYHENNFTKLSQFGETNETYGKEYKLCINNKVYKAIALCHPRQAAKLGISSEKWFKLHEYWVKERNENRAAKK